MESITLMKTIPKVHAELVIDKEKLAEKTGAIPSEAEVTVRIDNAIREINKSLPQYKIIKYFMLTCEPIEITTILKIKRTVECNKINVCLNRVERNMRKAQENPCRCLFSIYILL